MKYLILLVVGVLVALLTAFGIQNPFPVTVRFFQVQSGAVPLYAVILVSVVWGVVLSSLLSVPGRIQRQLELRRLRQQVAEQTREIAELRARLPQPVMQPLPDEAAQ